MFPVFRRLVLSAVMTALAVPGVPLLAAPAPAGQAATGTISGSARSASGQAMPNATVRLRNVQTGQLAGSTTSGAGGEFSFAALNPGTYVVEVVNAVGEVVGTSAVISLTPTALAATGVTVTASAVEFLAEAGGGSFFASTLGIVAIAAVGAGVVGAIVVANKDDASPSR
jgi:Carboxypeptidase regulatory-like domain